MLTLEVDPTKYDEVLKEVVKDYRNSILTKYFGVASFTILVWDHIITFPDEVELIWKGGKGHVVYLFFLNRYLIPLSFVVNLWAYFSLEGTLGSQSCSHFVRFEGSMTMIGISVVALMLFLRIRALYADHAGKLVIQAIIISILLTFVGVNSWLLTHGIPVPHYLATSCTMIVDPDVPAWIASSTAWLPLLYDTVVVSLTLYRTGGALYSASKSTGEIFRVMLREGLLYYSAICTVTLAFTIMIVSADPSVRNITAQLELCLTVAMMSRITLHLKRFGHGDTVISSYATRRPHDRSLPPFVARPHGPSRRGFETTREGTLPGVSFTPGWSTSAPEPFDTVYEGESFALEPYSSAAASAPRPHPSSEPGTTLADGSRPPATIDLGGV
ncbi:hypothetical protein EDB85DRAFT_2150229 [Lactarius pseudohatsudake]|nr:hypothetical protein EDB85DRAFT_2150229 [Lactarius pseudohatsudake]